MGNARIKHVGSKFTIVPNQIMDDPTISFRAKGVYAYLRSKPDNWEYRVQNITRNGKEGRDAIQKALKELEDSGYIERIANRTSDGCFDGWIWYIYETMINRENDRLPENPSDGFPVGRESRQTGSQAEINNTIYNNNIHKNIVHNNTAASIVATFQDYDINIETGIKRNSELLPLLLTFSEKEILIIAETLRKKSEEGKIRNPVGLLVQDPEKICKAIVAGKFYPGPPKTQKQYGYGGEGGEYEIFHLP